jgi:pyridoxine 5-phosphate synthase
MATLGVCIDSIAALRQARGGHDPDPVQAAVLIEVAGASSIGVHLREDRRLVQERDVYLLKQIVSTSLNLHIAPVDELVRIAIEVLPHTVTLVPERQEERPSEGGLTVRGKENELAKAVAALQDNTIEVSLLVDPDIQQIKAAKRIGATRIDLNTGSYARATGPAVFEHLESLRDAAYSAHTLGLRVGAERGLDYRNAADIARLRRADSDLIDDITVGHAIVARGALVGLENAVRDMLSLLG